MTPVEDFIYGFEGEQREILLYFHQFLTDLNLRSKISYKIPFYYGKSWICYLNPRKDGKVELGFPRGAELSNDQGLLEARDRKMVMGVVFEDVNRIPMETVTEVIHEAIILDENVPYFPNRFFS